MFADSLEDKLQKQPAGEDDKIAKEDSQKVKVTFLAVVKILVSFSNSLAVTR
jgi:hypothetical protein